MPWAAAIGAAGAIGGALISSKGAKDAANTQAGAEQAGIDAENAKFDKVQSLLAPYVQASTGTPGGFDAAAYLAQNPDVAADPYYSQHPLEHFQQHGQSEGRAMPMAQATQGSLGAYQDLIGLNGQPAQQAGINNIQNGAEFGSLAKQGQDALLQSASATGGLRGGNTENGLATFRSNLLSTLIDKQLSRYGGLTQMGQNSAAGVGTAAMATGQGVAGLLGQQGAAQAGGIMAGTNALTGAVGNISGLIAGRTAQQTSAGVTPPNPFVNQPNFGSGTVSNADLSAAVAGNPF